MRQKFYLLLISVLLLATGAGLAYQKAAAIGAQSVELSQNHAPSALGDLYIVLNEVMPKPASGGAAWVELAVRQEMQNLFLPFLGFHAPAASAASSPLQGAFPMGQLVLQPGAVNAAVDPSGWQVSNEAGQVYTLPAAVPPLSKGAFVLIYFDGTGPAGDDYDASDGKIVLHTPGGLGDIFTDEAGQVALYQAGARTADNIQDFVAWGGFSETTGANAVAGGVWGDGQAASFENGFGDISMEDILESNESLGRFPGGTGIGVNVWANYPSTSLTPGAANPVQPVLFITPENGAKVDATTLSLSWREAAGAAYYRFQLDNNADFSSPIINTTTVNTYFKPNPALAAGKYYWRINPVRGGQSSGWSSGYSIEAVSFAANVQGSSSIMGTTAEKVLGIARVRQNKDSYLLGLDGAPEGDPTTNTPENAWDSPAPCTEPPCVDTTKYTHGRMYCVRASIRMVASYYHANPADKLSMDRISYYVLEEWAGNTHPGNHDGIPDNDLGYNKGMYYPDEEDEGFSWALNISYNTPGGKPSFATVKTNIDANRPIMFRNPGHMMVIDGYRETAGGDQYLHVLDPDQPPDFERWQDYSTQTIAGYWVGPASGTSRKDEASVSTDSDGDGIMDFDETRRFNLDPYDADTDDDWVPDKQDMREYVFNNAGDYNFRGSDWDSDGIRKELDVDNDNDGTPDGCEDTNYNGKYEGVLSETDNFNAGSSQACVPIFNILYPLHTEAENAGDPSSPDKILVQVSTAVPAGWTLGLTAGDFDVQVGGSAASVISVYPSADTYFLVVAPPAQSTAGYYNLSVNLSGVGSDSETNAVYYLPKAPNDEVIVLDRSGSMITADKIGAAKNAASAFVDFLNNGDWVGVTSFATSASTDFPLTEITADIIRQNAITAINGLSATGTTALGQGVQQGYGLLTGAGHSDHDWSLVLLSDGWENVAPYWADIAGSVTDAVVHTVALGEDADTGLLQSIAGAKHGNYFFVDVNPPVAAATNGIYAGPPLAFANQLPNRLADTYLAIGELTHGYHRLYNASGPAIEQQVIVHSVEINKGIPEAIFHVNWNDPAGYLTLSLLDPDGNPVRPDPQYRTNTHHQVRVQNPKAGIWTVQIGVLKPAAEYNLMVSGKTNTSLIAAVGGDPETRTTRVPVPIYGVLTDEKPILGADVYALIAGQGVQTPGMQEVSGSAILQLFDDGMHGDGKANDGLYGNDFAGTTAPGGYTVKVVASGKNNAGETFLRYANTGFNVRPRLAYLWEDDEYTALDFRKLLQGNGWVVDLVNMTMVPKTSFIPYDLIVVGPDTGNLGSWGTPEAVTAVVTSEKRVLGLGEGGYAFFGKLNLNIGYSHGAHGSGTSITWANSPDSIWATPYNITLLKEPLQLYAKPVGRVDIYLGGQPPNVTIFGYNDADGRYADLIMENDWFMLWSFDGGPRLMTETGRRLFVNTTFRTAP